MSAAATPPPPVRPPVPPRTTAALPAPPAVDPASHSAAARSFLAVHAAFADTPWWVAIGLTTVAFRGALLAPAALSHRNMHRLGKAAPNLRLCWQHYRAESAKLAGAGGGAAARAAKLRQLGTAWGLTLRLEKASVAAAVALPVAQVAGMVCFIGGLRQLIDARAPGLVEGGPAHCPDLTEPDKSYVLPALSLAAFYANIELAFWPKPGADGAAAAAAAAKPSASLLSRALQPTAIREGLQTLMIVALPFMTTLPAGVFFYLLPSSALGAAQFAFFRAGGVRAWVTAAARAAGPKS